MCCRSPIFKPFNLRCVKFDSMLSRPSVRPMESKKTQGDCSVRQFFHPPSLVITQVKKSPKITSSSTSPYSYNISFSPSSLHLRPDFSLLPTFLDHFSLLPIVYLPPLSTCRVGYHTSKLTSKPKCGLLLKTSIVWYRCVFNNYSSSPNGL